MSASGMAVGSLQLGHTCGKRGSGNVARTNNGMTIGTRCFPSKPDIESAATLRVNDGETLAIAPDNQGDPECPQSCRTTRPPSLRAHPAPPDAASATARSFASLTPPTAAPASGRWASSCAGRGDSSHRSTCSPPFGSIGLQFPPHQAGWRDEPHGLSWRVRRIRHACATLPTTC